jgi:hypothetical protein
MLYWCALTKVYFFQYNINAFYCNRFFIMIGLPRWTIQPAAMAAVRRFGRNVPQYWNVAGSRLQKGDQALIFVFAFFFCLSVSFRRFNARSIIR